MTPLSNLIAFFILVTALLLVWQQRWEGQLRLFAAQSVLLAMLAVVISALVARRGLLLVALAVFIIKAWIIPRALGRIASGASVRAAKPGRSMGLRLLVAGGLVIVSYVIMLPVTRASALPTTGAIPLAFATALIGLFVCVTGRNAFGQILGFLIFENGVFCLALLATYGLPGLVEGGVLLDVLVAVLIMESVAMQIRQEHDSIEVDRLKELRG